jgi:hypothetical protein
MEIYKGELSRIIQATVCSISDVLQLIYMLILVKYYTMYEYIR